MAFFLNFHPSSTDVINLSRQATRHLDNLSITYPNGEADAASSIDNLNAVKTTLSGYADYISDAKDAWLILSDATQGLSQIQSKLSDLRTIARMGQSVSYSDELRDEWNGAFKTYVQDILTLANQYEFQNNKLLTGSFTDQEFTIGPASSNTLNLSISDHTPGGLDISDANIDSSYNAGLALESIDAAINTINSNMSDLMQKQSQLDATLDKHNIKFVKLPEPTVQHQNVPTTQTHNYNVDLQNDRFETIKISNIKDTTTNMLISTDKNSSFRHPNVDPQKIIVFLYQRNSQPDEHQFSLKL